MTDSQFISGLADKLRKIRREGIATQLQIEAATGVSQETISKILNGKRRRRNGTIEKLDKYANMLISKPEVSEEVSEAVVEFLAFGTEAELVASIRHCARLASRRLP